MCWPILSPPEQEAFPLLPITVLKDKDVLHFVAGEAFVELNVNARISFAKVSETKEHEALMQSTPH